MDPRHWPPSGPSQWMNPPQNGAPPFHSSNSFPPQQHPTNFPHQMIHSMHPGAMPHGYPYRPQGYQQQPLLPPGPHSFPHPSLRHEYASHGSPGMLSLPSGAPSLNSLPRVPESDSLPLSGMMLQGTGPHAGRRVDAANEKVPGRESDAGENSAECWSAHKAADGSVYYFNSITGLSTFEKPRGFNVDDSQVTAQPTPISCEQIGATDWSLVTTDDNKKYYYNTKTQVASWQVPPEVAEARSKNLLEGSSDSKDAPSLQSPSAMLTGGREAVGHKGSASTLLEHVKKKLLQDPEQGEDLPTAAGSDAGAAQENGGGKEESAEDEEAKKKEQELHEERVAQFKAMLKERGVAPFSKWDKELPKIIFDPRFKAIPSQRERREIFDFFVKTRAEEDRKEKRAAQKAAMEAFRCLLDEIESELDHTSDAKKIAERWGDDPRFQAVERKERDSLIAEKLAPMKKAEEERRSEAMAAFRQLLAERSEINHNSRWSKVKEQISDDPRYSSLPREQREALFSEHIKLLLHRLQQAEREAQLKREAEKEEKRKEKLERQRIEKEQAELMSVRRKEATIQFKSLLSEMFKEPEISWAEASQRLGSNSSLLSILGAEGCEKIFVDHCSRVLEVCKADFRELLLESISLDLTLNEDGSERNVPEWSSVKEFLMDDERYSALPAKYHEAVWQDHVALLKKAEVADGAEKDGSDKESEESGQITEGKEERGARHGNRGERQHGESHPKRRERSTKGESEEDQQMRHEKEREGEDSRKLPDRERRSDGYERREGDDERRRHGKERRRGEEDVDDERRRRPKVVDDDRGRRVGRRDSKAYDRGSEDDAYRSRERKRSRENRGRDSHRDGRY